MLPGALVSLHQSQRVPMSFLHTSIYSTARATLSPCLILLLYKGSLVGGASPRRKVLLFDVREIITKDSDANLQFICVLIIIYSHQGICTICKFLAINHCCRIMYVRRLQYFLSLTPLAAIPTCCQNRYSQICLMYLIPIAPTKSSLYSGLAGLLRPRE